MLPKRALAQQAEIHQYGQTQKSWRISLASALLEETPRTDISPYVHDLSAKRQ